MSDSGNVLQLLLTGLQGDPWCCIGKPAFKGMVSEGFEVNEFRETHQLAEVRWYLDRSLDLPEHGNVLRARDAERILNDWAQQLRTTINQSELCRMWLDRAGADRTGRLEIVAGSLDDSRALGLPWELMNVQSHRPSPLHEFGIEVVRRFRNHDDVPGRREQLEILLAVSRPTDLPFINPRATARAVIEAVDKIGASVHFSRPGTFAALKHNVDTARARGRPIRILHFDGHGSSEALAGDNFGGLSFEGDDGNAHIISANEFANAVHNSGVTLVITEACNSADAESGPNSLPIALLQAGIPAVIAMPYSVHVDMTRWLMTALYGALAEGCTVARALVLARETIQSRKMRRLDSTVLSLEIALSDWFAPQLFQTVADVSFVAPTSAPVTAGQSLVQHLPTAPLVGFQGRENELYLIEHAVLREPVVCIHGIAGSGKTALAREAAEWWTRTQLFELAIWLSIDGRPTREYLVKGMLEAVNTHLRDQILRTEQALIQFCSERTCIIVWDNFRPIPETAWPQLIELTENLTQQDSRLLLTSRSPKPFPGLTASVDLLQKEDATRLLTLLLSSTSPSHSLPQHSLERIIKELDCHPLALELFAAAIKEREDMPTPDRALELASTSAQDHWDAQNRSAELSLREALDGLSDDARIALPVLALMRGGGLDSIAESGWGLQRITWESVRSELEAAGLVRLWDHVVRPNPFISHFSPAPTAAVIHGFLEGIASLGHEYLVQAQGKEDTGIVMAMRLSEAVIQRAILLAFESGNPMGAFVIEHPLRVFLEREGRRAEAANMAASLAPTADLKRGSIFGWGYMQLEQAVGLEVTDPKMAYSKLTELLDAISHSSQIEQESLASLKQQAVLLLREVEAKIRPSIRKPDGGAQPDGAFWAVRGRELLDQGDLLGATDAARNTVEQARLQGNANVLARRLILLGEVLAAQQLRYPAEAAFSEGLRYAAQTEDRETSAAILLAWSKLSLSENLIDLASSQAQDAAQEFRGAGDRRGEVLALNALGNIERQRNQYERALSWLDRAVTISSDLEEPSPLAMSKGHRALCLKELARTADPNDRQRLMNDALAEEREVAAIFQQIGQLVNIAMAQINISNTLIDMNLLDEAGMEARKSVDTLEELCHPLTATALKVLERIAGLKNDNESRLLWESRRAVAEAWERGEEVEAKIPIEMASGLIELALKARAMGLPFKLMCVLSRFDLARLYAVEPGFTHNIVALAKRGAVRPKARVLSVYRPLLEKAWTSTTE